MATDPDVPDLGTPRLIGVDWGTSSLRAYLLGDGGTVLDRRSAPRGIMAVENDEFAGHLEDVVSPWREHDLPILLSGMIGSRQGWREAPYVPCPASLAEIAAAITPACGGVPSIVPGVLQGGRLPGVMRGEETQIIGATASDGMSEGERRIVLPGTHSKWVVVVDGRIERFRTFMTGELFAVLGRHSILGRFVPVDREPRPTASEAFVRGVVTSREAGESIATLLFTARSLVLTGQLDPSASLDYLSGLLIGDEIRAALAEPGGPVTLIGEPALCGLYAASLDLFGTEATIIDDAAPNGLWRIAAASNLVHPATSDD